ncbi:tripartite tricarboxylate transporter TctB family protein [Vibrio sp. SCSIO 43137]|uniref:tripartite tricarboxylate transporter TctB family protein n=1 Tax=Vibrio sp. SCSIO 43137 TaxID=3021011 RepID=UPI002307CADF|nr:tripartite tricarboxylate transporter TctB family protein [Vibrio sp. SCSIO 43137]WCE30461.1 tripartite tricarboxylate transporter TctB family protein [Vibrio sp. SCSIO 43137]
MKITNNIIGSMIFIGLSIFILYVIPDQILATNNEGINAQSFPRWVTFLMLASSLLLLATELVRQIRNKDSHQKVNLNYKKEAKSILYISFIILFALAIPIFGFLISSVLFSCFSLLFFKVKKTSYYAFLITCCVVVSYVFKTLLLVQLP